jgi:hypothetical protein
MTDDYCVVLFHSTSSAIRAEAIAKREGLKVKLTSVPRHLSSDCGLCLCIENYDKEKILEILKRCGIEFESINQNS